MKMAYSSRSIVLILAITGITTSVMCFEATFFCALQGFYDPGVEVSIALLTRGSFCAQSCLNTDDCNSFNYYPSNDRCELILTPGYPRPAPDGVDDVAWWSAKNCYQHGPIFKFSADNGRVAEIYGEYLPAEGNLITEAHIGDAMTLNGVDTYLNFGTHWDSCFGNPALCQYGFTWALWMKLPSVNPGNSVRFQTCAGYGYDAYAIGTSIRMNPDTQIFVAFMTHEIRMRCMTSAFNRDEWFHFAFIWDHGGSACRLYVNGIRVASVDQEVNLRPYLVNGTVEFGRNIDPQNRYGLGGLDEVQVWGRSMGDDEIAEVYASY